MTYHYDLVVLFRDFGFDPLRFGEVPENLERYKESELIHCRWAMLAVVCIMSHDSLISGIQTSNQLIPVIHSWKMIIRQELPN